MKTRLYNIWCLMKQRCKNPHRKDYERYGGRGIKYCPEWESFEGFERWAIENGYREDLTIDRIDNNGDYGPENCRWATVKQQNNNKRNNVYVTMEGETKTLMEWAEVYGTNYKTVYSRITQWHWNIEKALRVKAYGG